MSCNFVSFLSPTRITVAVIRPTAPSKFSMKKAGLRILIWGIGEISLEFIGSLALTSNAGPRGRDIMCFSIWTLETLCHLFVGTFVGAFSGRVDVVLHTELKCQVWQIEKVVECDEYIVEDVDTWRRLGGDGKL